MNKPSLSPALRTTPLGGFSTRNRMKVEKLSGGWKQGLLAMGLLAQTVISVWGAGPVDPASMKSGDARQSGSALSAPRTAAPGLEFSLDGTWEVGEARNYSRQAPVPGLAQDPAAASKGPLWYRRSVALPTGDWTRATLVLNGARFAPTVYVNNLPVSSAEGGMARTIHLLKSPDIAPGRTVTIEVELKSLQDLDPRDASVIPKADLWRSNASSGLWDAVSLHLSGGTRIERLTPWTDFTARTVDVHWSLDSAAPVSGARVVQVDLLDTSGREVARSAPTSIATDARSGVTRMTLGKEIVAWSPDAPTVYRLRLSISEGGKIQDCSEIPWGLREFKTTGLGFQLNGNPVHLRAASFVWHRFLRFPEAGTLAFDRDWFAMNIGQRLHALGANTIRFHLGLPPEALLDYCDRSGFLVQMEWSLFHGISASPESLRVQWRAWMDTAMRHPSVVLLHPWNETDGEQLRIGQAALADLVTDYPPLVISHRDVLHLHKYWWSLFENLGLSYDSAKNFSQPVMADEFGGNYLDFQGEAGTYPTNRDGYLRFLGRDQTTEGRLRHHAESNARIAEYWRRLGVGGFSPFCMAGSPQDGNSWFLGSLANPKPMPVWAALAAAYAPQSVSLEVWNRNYTPGQQVVLPLYVFNDLAGSAPLEVQVRVVAEADGKVRSKQNLPVTVPAFGTEIRPVSLTMPNEVGDWRLEAELLTPVTGVSVPIVSSWRCRTLTVNVPVKVARATFGIPEDETELRAWLLKHGARVTGIDDPSAHTLVFGKSSWPTVTNSPAMRDQMETAIKRGCSVVMLDFGPCDARRPKLTKYPLFAGIDVVFRAAAEPESHLHPAKENQELWHSLPRESTWLWNGLRGGLIVPPSAMEVNALDASAFTTLWTNRGASRDKLTAGAPLFAYELGGYYAFSSAPKDDAVSTELRRKVKFLVDDAPSLQGRIDPAGPITITDLAAALKSTGQGKLIPLANCGKGLNQIPVAKIEFGRGQGCVILSQLLTSGRLLADDHPLKTYEIGHDPAAEQLVLNLLDMAVPTP